MVKCQGIVREMSGNFEPTEMWQPCQEVQITGFNPRGIRSRIQVGENK